MEFGTSRGSYQYSSDSPKNANEISIGATASKVCNTHSDEMSRVGHILSYPGAASLITKMLFLSLSSEACPISKVHRFGMSSRKMHNCTVFEKIVTKSVTIFTCNRKM